MTAQLQTTAPPQIVPRTPVGAFLRYLAVTGEWLKKNLKEALTVALVGFVIGWVINFVLMAFFYDGFRTDETMAATGQGNVRNGMLIWSLFSSVAFGLIAYRRAVGKERFRHDLANFPGAIMGVFRKDGDAVWTHILWGAAISLLATFLIARWAGLGVAAVLAAAAFSPLGLILAAMITQLWRAIMRSLMPMKTRRATGPAGLFVGLFTSSLVLLAGVFITNEREKLIVGALCLVAAIVVGRRQALPPAATALLLIAPLLWLLFPELGLADDGGFKEAGGDFGAWAQGGGLEEITGYSGYGGVATAIGGLAGWMAGAVNGVSPPPEGGWEAGLEGEPDLDPGGGPIGDGLPPMTAPVAATAGDPAPASDTPDPADDASAPDGTGEPTPPSPDEAVPAEETPAPATAVEEPAPAAAPPAAATPAAATPPSDREPTDDEIAAMSEEEYRAWRNRAPAGDPDSPAEILRRAQAGDPEAAARWEEIKGEGDPSFLDRAASVILGPAYDAIGGSDTLIELAKTDWIDEGLDTAAALRDAAGRRLGQIADTAVETAQGAYDLAGMDASEVSGMFGAIGESVANSAVGRIVDDTIDGAVELAGMDADELAGMVGQVRDDAADAVVERIEQAQTLVEGMTVEEAIGHLNRAQEATGEALTEADRAIRRQAQEVMRMNPDAVRDALADGTIAVVEELGVEVLTGGLGAARHADEVVDAARAADNAVDAARAAENATDAARAADRGSDTARAGTPDSPPARDAPDAPDAPARSDAPESPDTRRAETADPASPPDPGPEGRGPGSTEGGRRDPDAPTRDAESAATEGVPPRTGPGDTMELDPAEGPGGVRPPEAPRQPAAASPETPAGSPPARSDEPWTDADTVRTPRRSVEAPGGTDPGRPPARPAADAPASPDAPDAPDGDLVFEMEDGKRVNMTSNRPEPPRPGSPADVAARGDTPATPPRNDPGADTLADGPPPARPPDQPDGDLVFEMEDGKRVNMTTNRPEPPRPGSPADPAVRADTEIQPPGPSSRSPSGSAPEPPAARTGPGGTQRLDPDDLPDGRTGPGGTQRLDPDDLPDGRTGPGGTQRLDPDDLPDARTGPGGTQRLDPDDLPRGRTGPGDTQRLDPEDLPDARTGPGGTQRLDPDDLPGAGTRADGTQRFDPPDLPEARTGPGGTQRLEAGDLPDGRRGAPVDRAPAGPGEEVRPGVRRAPDGTHQVRMSRTEAERILGDAEPGRVSRTAPTERMPPDATDLDDAAPGARGAPEDARGPGAIDQPTPGDPVEAARHENARFREGMESARRDLDGPAPGAGAAPAPTAPRSPDADPTPSSSASDRPASDGPEAAPEAAEEPRPKPRRTREPSSRSRSDDGAGPATERLPDPDLPPDEATAAARARADGMRDDMETIGNHPLDDAPAPGGRDRAGPATGRLRDPDLPPDEATAAARARAEAMRDDMDAIGNSPLDDAGPPRDRNAPETAPPAPEAAPGARDRAGSSTRRLRDPDLPPDEATAAARARAEAMREDMEAIGNSPLDDAGPPRDRNAPETAPPAPDAAPGARDRAGPSTRRLRDPDLPPDEATAAARARAEAMREDMEAIGNSPLDDTGTARLGDPNLPPTERPSGASRSPSASEPPPAGPESRPGGRGGRSGSVDSRAETIAPPDTPPGREAARPGPAAETPAPDSPADGRGPSRGTPPASSAPDVPVISGSQGRLLENQTVTARTVTGLDDLGRPIVHPHDQVTVPVGQHLRSGSFSDVFASTEGYFGSDPENTLVRISKPISTDAGAQSLRADRIGREALVQVQDEIASPRVLGTFEIMDETGGRRVMEVVENVTVGDQRGIRAADVLRDRAMNIEEAMAYDRATRALNDRGYVSLDLHEGNFTLIDQADGARKLGVFDPGGIMPVRGNDPEVARIIQSRINAPGPDVLRVRPDFSTQIIQEEVRELLLQHVDGEALGIDLNEFIFKPNMGRNHPLVRELFSADDPDALYRQLRGAADR